MKDFENFIKKYISYFILVILLFNFIILIKLSSVNNNLTDIKQSTNNIEIITNKIDDVDATNLTAVSYALSKTVDEFVNQNKKLINNNEKDSLLIITYKSLNIDYKNNNNSFSNLNKKQNELINKLEKQNVMSDKSNNK